MLVYVAASVRVQGQALVNRVNNITTNIGYKLISDIRG